jgi:hypothetical protein
MGHGVTETRKTSTEGIQDTSVSTTVWDNPVISVVESEVVHTNVLIYAGAGTQFEYSRSNECIDDGDYLIQHTSEGFVLPAFNVGHSRNKWVGIGVSDYGVSFGYIYNRTETTDVVPRVIGLSLVGAYDLIVANGFAWGSVTTTFSEVYPAGRVISQSVTAGALADLGSAIDLVVSDGPAPEPCECDLNADGRCDMRDWLAFGQRWGATNCSSVPCACDLNADGRCDMRDWLLFGTDWGRTDCPLP